MKIIYNQLTRKKIKV